MPSILRVKARWSGFQGAPGYTVLHFRDFTTGDGGGSDPTADQAVQAAGRVRTFFAAIAATLPLSVRVDIEPEVELIDVESGELQNSFSAGTQAQVAGTGNALFTGPVGAVVNWKTAGVRNGRRLRGRSFIVPVNSSGFTTTGVLHPTNQASLQAAATALCDSNGSPDLVVYGRPSAPTPKNPNAPTLPGQIAVATSATVPALAAVLRSRRD